MTIKTDKLNTKTLTLTDIKVIMNDNYSRYLNSVSLKEKKESLFERLNSASRMVVCNQYVHAYVIMKQIQKLSLSSCYPSYCTFNA